jgi:hypothetical protein
MPLRFIAAVDRLKQANEQLSNGRITSVQHAAMREAALIKALKELAMGCDVELKPPIGIDGQGYIHIIVQPKNDASTNPGKAQFGQAFTDLLNDFSPNNGQRANAKLLPQSDRCQMNHQNVEKMILSLHAKLAAGHSQVMN